MTIDILSDLHTDFYFHRPPDEKKILSLYGNALREGGDVLVVAGDLGHNNRQSLQVLRKIREVFGYRYILCVLGNHDHYLIDPEAAGNYRNSSLRRAERMRKMINDEEGMRCLDGDVLEIDGVRFGGCDGWYDGRYIQRHFPGEGSAKETEEFVSRLWRGTMADSRYLKGMDWRGHAEREKEKLRRIHDRVDVMITHVNPSIEREHTSPRYRDMETTGFFTFDGAEFLEKGSMKYWIFGHSHERIEYETHGVKCLCNAMGYPGESMDGRGVEPMRMVFDHGGENDS